MSDSQPSNLVLASTEQRGAEVPALTLTAIEGLQKGQVFTFVGHDTFLVGRSKQAHLCLNDNYFSRYHFLVEINPPASRLTDLGSRNGTYVNGQRTQAADLRDGDVITAGRTTLLVAIPSAAKASTGDTAGVTAPEAQTLDLPAGQPPPPCVVPIASDQEHQQTLGMPPASAVPQPQSETCPFPPTRPVQPVSAAVMPQVPGYQMLRELGRGGMGVVYLAKHLSDGVQVALKTILPTVAADRKQKDRFLREANILCQLRHRHIVSFREMGEAQGYLFFAMDYVEGTDAQKLLKERGPMAVREASRLLIHVLTGLDYAHTKGFVHRDIKPANIFVAREEDKKVVKVGDFGLARVYQESRMSGLTMQGDLAGTLGFMPPEQIKHFRLVKPAADQYSAAAMLYTLLTDKYLFDFETARGRELSLILQEEPVPIRQRRPDVPEELANVLQRALAKEPEARYADVLAFRTALIDFAR